MATCVGLGCALFGWAPDAAWGATPRDLIHAIEARVALLRGPVIPPLTRAGLDDLKARLKEMPCP